MKKIILVIVSALFFAFIANAQPYFNLSKYDSISNSTAPTTELTFPGISSGMYSYSITLQADSISGSTAGVMYFQVSNMPSGNYWKTVSSTTINGVQTTALLEDTLCARRARFYFTGGGTQKTYLRYGIHAVRMTP